MAEHGLISLSSPAVMVHPWSSPCLSPLESPPGQLCQGVSHKLWFQIREQQAADLFHTPSLSPELGKGTDSERL